MIFHEDLINGDALMCRVVAILHTLAIKAMFESEESEARPSSTPSVV